jgi:hypothetical protein
MHINVRGYILGIFLVCITPIIAYSQLFEFSGTADLNYYYSNQPPKFSTYPQSYLRFNLSTQVQIADIPLGLSALLTTENNSHKQSMNQINFHFDAQEFRRNMEQKLRDKVGELTDIGKLEDLKNLSSMKEGMIKDKFPKLEEWKKELIDANIQDQLSQLSQLDGLNEVLQNKELLGRLDMLTELQSKYNISTLDDIESLRSKLPEAEYKKLQILASFKTEYDNLKKRKEQLENLADNLKKYEKLARKIEKAENLDLITSMDKKELFGSMKSMGLMDGASKIFSGIRGLAIGKSYPQYTRYTMDGLSISGVAVEFNPGLFYIAGAYGNSAKEARDVDFGFNNYSFPQKTIAARIGVGSPEKSHLHLTYLHIEDKGDEPYEDIKIGPLYPLENIVYSIDFKMLFAKDNVAFGGEVASSIYTRDKTLESVAIDPDEINAPLQSLWGDIYNESSAVDYAARLYVNMSI